MSNINEQIGELASKLNIKKNQVGYLFIEKALKELQEATIKGMLVEEEIKEPNDRGYGHNFNVGRQVGFNQFCAIQKENAKKLKKGLWI